MGDMFLPLKRYFEFSGRSRRREYWLFVLLYTVLLTVATVLDIQLGLGGDYYGYSNIGDGSFEMSFNVNFGPLAIGVMALLIIPIFAAGIRRMHDVDKSGWFIWVPIYNLILACSDGTHGPNRFGPDPKAPPASRIFS
jgi:uncharacterized membrane protein YhaH (DUF805 family)